MTLFVLMFILSIPGKVGSACPGLHLSLDSRAGHFSPLMIGWKA